MILDTSQDVSSLILITMADACQEVNIRSKQESRDSIFTDFLCSCLCQFVSL